MAILPTGDSSKYDFESIKGLIKNVTDFALLIGGGIAVLYLILGAYWYFTAFGNEEKATKAKTTITWAVIGVVVIILSKVIVSEIFKFIAENPPNVP